MLSKEKGELVNGSMGPTESLESLKQRFEQHYKLYPTFAGIKAHLRNRELQYALRVDASHK